MATPYSNNTACSLVKDFATALVTARRAVLTEYRRALRASPSTRTWHRRLDRLAAMVDDVKTVLREQVLARLGEERGVLLAIVDDTPLAKRGRTFDNIASCYDHARGCYYDGYTPLSVALYRNAKIGVVETMLAPGNKLDSAIAAFDALLTERTPPDAFVFDTWYATTHMLLHLEQQGATYVTRLKSNRRVLDRQCSLRELAASVTHDQYERVRIRRRTFWVVDTVLDVNGLGEQRVLIVKDGVHRTPVFLTTNHAGFNTRFVLSLYQRRWQIEVFFKDAKQLLNFATLQCRTKAKWETHQTLVRLVHWCFQRRHSISKAIRRVRDSVEKTMSYINENRLFADVLDALRARCQT